MSWQVKFRAMQTILEPSGDVIMESGTLIEPDDPRVEEYPHIFKPIAVQITDEGKAVLAAEAKPEPKAEAPLVGHPDANAESADQQRPGDSNLYVQGDEQKSAAKPTEAKPGEAKSQGTSGKSNK